MNKYIDKKKEGLITSIDYKRPSVKISYWILFSVLVIVSIVALAPICWAFFSGFKELDEFYSITPTFFPNKIEAKKLVSILNDMKLGRAFINSMILFAGCWFGNIIVGGIAGYTISRLKPRGSKFLFTLMLWTMMMPHTLSLVPLFLTWVDFPILHINFQDTYIPFWVAAMANVFNILLFKNFFDDIPSSYIEAAKIDGCSNIGIFFRIVVPISKPIVATISIFEFNACWNGFLMPYLLLKKSSLATVALRLYSLSGSWTQPEQMLAAFIVMIPSVIVFIICSRHILGNNMNVGVKE